MAGREITPEITLNQPHLVDKDAHCRLRHGLNVQCLVHIFQYLDSADLYKLSKNSETNDFYKQIINELVIPKHVINFDRFFNHNVVVTQQVFEGWGKNIRKIIYNFDRKSLLSLFLESAELFELVKNYCSIDQLKSVTIGDVSEIVNLPAHFRNVEVLKYYGNARTKLSAELSECLRHLTLESIVLDREFDWTKLVNLREIHLKRVAAINEEKFLSFLRLQQSIEVFHHDEYTFGDSTQTICEEMAKQCGNRIRDYSGRMPYLIGVEAPPQSLYNFISELKNVKKVCLTTYQLCAGDLVYVLKRLAEYDTIETLNINYSDVGEFDVNCDMRHFSHLKTITLQKRSDHMRHICPHERMFSHSVHLLNVYASQMLSNVENLSISSVNNWNFIKFAPKLRYLKLIGELAECDKSIIAVNATLMLSLFVDILRNRSNEQTSDDSIEICFQREKDNEIFEWL